MKIYVRILWGMRGNYKKKKNGNLFGIYNFKAEPISKESKFLFTFLHFIKIALKEPKKKKKKFKSEFINQFI